VTRLRAGTVALDPRERQGSDFFPLSSLPCPHGPPSLSRYFMIKTHKTITLPVVL
jgi:hypothetical protein